MSAWGGRQAEAMKLLTKCLQVGEDTDFQHIGGGRAFEAECGRLIENPTLIEQVVERQIAALGIANLPESKFLCT